MKKPLVINELIKLLGTSPQKHFKIRCDPDCIMLELAAVFGRNIVVLQLCR